MCFPTLGDTSRGVWDTEEAWQVEVIEGKKCLVFKEKEGAYISRGVAGVMLRGQTKVSTLVPAFIDSRIARGLNPWCEHEGISLTQLMKT